VKTTIQTRSDRQQAHACWLIGAAFLQHKSHENFKRDDFTGWGSHPVCPFTDKLDAITEVLLSTQNGCVLNPAYFSTIRQANQVTDFAQVALYGLGS
jgi:hypothetical protein